MMGNVKAGALDERETGERSAGLNDREEGLGSRPAMQPAAPRVTEENCPGHVASEGDPKICAHCGVPIDALRPDTEAVAPAAPPPPRKGKR